MVEVIGVRFNSAGKIYYFDPKGQQFSIGANILVETARGVELGHVVIENKEVEDSEIVPPLRPIIRLATADDFNQVAENKEKEKEAFIIASEKVREHGLDMKLVDVEYTFDRSKILFYFTADGRVDFRELVKTLAGIFHTRIELRQIGVRDEARQLGSYGICGRYLCCGTFLDDFRPVSIKMAKEQGLSLNPTKISGICGRLMCCLQYEQNAYDDMLAKLPSKGTVVETADGKGIVVDVATLKGEVKVKFEEGDAVRFNSYKLGEFSFNGRRTLSEGDNITIADEPVVTEIVEAVDTIKKNEAAEASDIPSGGEKSHEEKKPAKKNNKKNKRDKRRPKKNNRDKSNPENSNNIEKKPFINNSSDDSE